MSESTLPVAVDVMGSDLGPDVIVRGAVDAANKLEIPSILVGKKDQIESALKKCKLKNSNLISIHHADEYVKMTDAPSKAIRTKDKNSLGIAFTLVKEGKASSVISAGNTGAMHAAGIFTVGTIDGITRPAIATVIPKSDDSFPTVLLDSGANAQCNANQLVQFGIMGKFYAKALFDIDNPRISILSNGTEKSKGNDLAKGAAQIFSAMEDINYIGYVEGRDIARDSTDVIVCDGFVGNVLLKTMEGSVELIVDSLKHYINGSLRGKLGMLLLRPIFKELFRKKLDPSSYGGAPLLGLNAIGIVCHGSANAKAIFNAVRVANRLHEADLVTQMQLGLTTAEEDIEEISYKEGLWESIGNKFNKGTEKEKE